MKGKKVVSLRGNVIDGGASPSQWILVSIKEMLDEAKRGEIAAIGFIKVRPNGEIAVGYRGQPGINHNHLVTAGCFYLMHDIAVGSAA